MDYKEKWELLKQVYEEFRAQSAEAFLLNPDDPDAVSGLIAAAQARGYMRVIEDNDFKTTAEMEEYLNNDRVGFWEKECGDIVSMLNIQEGETS